MTPEQAIAALPQLEGAVVLRRLANGPVSATWLVQVADEQYVLSIDTALAKALGLNRAREFELLQQIAPHDLGPAPIAVNAEAGLLAVTAVAGTPPAPKDVHRPEALRALGEKLARLHALDVDAPRLDLAAAIERYARLATGSEPVRLAGEAIRLLASLPSSGKACLCHNDLHPANLIQTPDSGLRLVDWEYAGLVDPCFEFAVLAGQNGLAKAELAIALQGYRAAGGRAGLTGDLVTAWTPLYHCVQQLWQAATGQRPGRH